MFPPPEAQRQLDGSVHQVGDCGSVLRWTQRADGSWRRPERLRDNAPSTFTSTPAATKPQRSYYAADEFVEVFHSPRDHDGDDLPVALGVPLTHLGQPNVAPFQAAKQVGLQDRRDSKQEDERTVRGTGQPNAALHGWACPEELRLSQEPPPEAVQQAPEVSLRNGNRAHKSAAEWLNGCDLGQENELARRERQEIQENDLARRERQEICQLKEPPAEAVRQADGSFIFKHQDGSMVRWTRRADGAWRKPEHKRAGWSSFKEAPAPDDGQAGQKPSDNTLVTCAGSSTSGQRDGEQNAQHQHSSQSPESPRCSSVVIIDGSPSSGRQPSILPPPSRPPPEPEPPRAPPAPRYEPPDKPPAAAVVQEDGTFLLELEDGSTVRWTKRRNGTWRKPERIKAGWVGDLERESYTIPALRGGEHLNLDTDYLRTPPAPARPKPAKPTNMADPTPERLANVLKLMQVGGWQ